MAARELLGLLIGAMILAGAVFAGSHYISGQRQVTTANSSLLALDAVRDRIDDSAYEAQAIFIPANDVGNHSNSDRHEIDIMAHDVNQRGHFVAYCFKATGSSNCGSSQTTGTLAYYTYLWAALPQNGGSGATEVAAIQSLSSFSAQTATTPTQFASATFNPVASAAFASYSGTASWPNQQTYHWGYPGVTSSSGQVYSISMASESQSLIAMVDAAHTPYATSGAIGTQTPTPNPEAVTSSLAFRAPVSAAQSASVTESNYGTRSTTPAQKYTIGSGCNGHATFAPASPVTPVANGTGSATLSILPSITLTPTGASCNVSVTDNTPQTENIGVTIGQTHAPSATGVSISFTPGAKAPITVSETNYDKPAAYGGRGGMQFVGFLANGTAALSSATSPDPNGVCSGAALAATPTLGGSPSFTETEAWNLSFSKAGICFPVYQDVYGQRVAVNGTNGVQATSPPLTVLPAAIEYPATAGATIPYPSLPVAYGPETLDVRVAKTINRALGGGIADAGAGPAVGTPCVALAFKDTGFTTLDGTDDAKLGTQGGCFTATGISALGLGSAISDVQASESGYSGTFSVFSGTCFSVLSQVSRSGSGATQNIGFTASGTPTTCTFNIDDATGQQKPVTADLIQMVEVKETTSGGCIIDKSGTEICKYDVKAQAIGYTNCDASVLNLADAGPPGDPSVGLFGDGNGNSDGWIVALPTQSDWANLLEGLTTATTATTSGCPLG